MNTHMLKSPKIILPVLVAAVALGAGGVAFALWQDDDLDGKTRDRAAAAALAEVGEGRVTSAERSDHDDIDAYEVEVTLPNGVEVDVLLDENFAVIATDDDRVADAKDGTNGTDDADDRALTAQEQQKASAAATAEVPGTVTDVDASDDRVGTKQAAYEVEVRAADGSEWIVWLDTEFRILDTGRDD